ncbi:MAG: hypothetical protein O3A01_03040 [bacterium]|nr:hypothetical protein [bacterium]
MFSSSFITYFLFAFIIGLAISNIAKIYFAIKNRRQEHKFLEYVQGRMTDLTSQIERRTMDMQETVDTVNNEYSNMMKDMSKKISHDYSGSLKEKASFKPKADAKKGPAKIIKKPESE